MPAFLVVPGHPGGGASSTSSMLRHSLPRLINLVFEAALTASATALMLLMGESDLFRHVGGDRQVVIKMLLIAAQSGWWAAGR